MSLSGTQIGPYRVGAPLGSGAMGEVYRAHDSNLGRDVAIKLLPLDVSQDADRRARVEREARLLAALHHPHIATIFAVEHTARGLALVMELVEGPTLAERIARGPLPAREALPIARQIADALDAAHEKGIVHRDLKPANIKLTAGGQVKVLDFGLATTGESAAGAGSVIATQLVSQPGTIVGTAQYMSPEQARGHVVDKRTDIWAFGCVLFELLAGRPVFDGQTSSDVMAKVIEREPAWNVLPTSTPPGVRRLLERCLDKDPKRRLRDIGDAGREIDDALAAPAQSSGKSGHRTNVAWVSALAVTAVVSALLAWRFAPGSSTVSTSAPVARLIVLPAEPLPVSAEGILAISPDGRRLVYVAGRDARRQLFVRGLDDFEAKPIPGTEGADSPVFSPDGEWLAFVADQKVKKVALAGGAPQTLAESAETLGLDWGPDNNIFFIVGRAGSGIWRVSASGGSPTAVTTLGPRDTSLLSPHVLPDGKALLFSSLIGSTSAQDVYVQSLQTGERRAIAKGAAPRYLPSGHVVFLQAGTLLAIPFDPVRLEATGAPVAVLQGIRQTGLGKPQFDFSESGTLAYVPASGGARHDALVWVDRRGMEEPAGLSGGIYEMPRLSPDGRRVALQMASGAGASTDLWLHDLGRDTLSRLTFDGSSLFPLWAPDGRRIAFSTSKTGLFTIFARTFDGSGPQEELLPARQVVTYPLAWSPDGHSMAIVSVSATTANDILVVDLRDRGAPRPFVETPFREGAPVFSHDGRWIAYVSDQSGRQEIYMRPFPGPGGEITISTEGGNEPVWARRTGQLFYRQGTTMMAVDIAMSPSLAVGKPHVLFDKPYNASNAFWPNYDVTPDGQRFLMLKSASQDVPTQINVVLNWFDELKRLAPTGRRQ